jgi:magnesium transporter
MQKNLVTDGTVWRPLEGDPLEATGLRWVDLEAPTEDELTALETRFLFHPLAVEDCRHLDQRSKLEEYGDHIFVVMHVFAADPGDAANLTMTELHCFVRENLLVTVHETPLKVIEAVRARALKGDRRGCRNAAAMLHEVLDSVVDDLFPVVEDLTDSTETLTEKILIYPDPQLLGRLLELKQAFNEVRRKAGPAREVLTGLSHGGLPGVCVPDAELIYFRNVLDHLCSLAQTLDSARDAVNDARDLYLNAQAARVNHVVKRLSVIATMGLPLTFITGFFGMNFEGLPFGNNLFMAVALSSMVLVPVVVFAGLRFKGWT